MRPHHSIINITLCRRLYNFQSNIESSRCRCSLQADLDSLLLCRNARSNIMKTSDFSCFWDRFFRKSLFWIMKFFEPSLIYAVVQKFAVEKLVFRDSEIVKWWLVGLTKTLQFSKSLKPCSSK